MRQGIWELIRSANQIVVDPFQGLTAKQCQVLDLLIEHRTSKEISRMLGISPHTVDQRIMLARAKLHVATRGEVAQAYRRLLAEKHTSPTSELYHRSVYGSPDLAAFEEARHDGRQEESDSAFLGGHRVVTERTGTAPSTMAQSGSGDPSPSYYHVLPEAFYGRVGTLMRLGAIAMITVFLTLIILGGLAIYSELSHLLDG